MKIVRYQKGNDIAYAAEREGGYVRVEGDIFGDYRVTNDAIQFDRLLAPVVPKTIWCIGLNYRHHAMEANMAIPERPVVFLKGANALQHPGAPIFVPNGANSSELDWEAELVIVIGKRCKNVGRERALDHVLGFTCGNDVSSRDWQLKLGGTQWVRGKSFDTFAPIGPALLLRDHSNGSGLRIQALLNGAVMQDSNTSDMIFDVPALVSFLSQSTTLQPGDIIFTGTPQGIGMARKPPVWLKDGDEISIRIDGIGTLTNPVRNE